MKSQNQHLSTQKDTHSWSRKKAWIAVAIAGLVGSLLGGTAMVTISLAEMSAGRRGWHEGTRGRHGSGHSRLSVDRTEEIAAHILDEIDATGSQREEVLGILKEVSGDLQVLADQHSQNHETFLDQLIATAIDREALEAIRRDEIQLADGASQRIVKALADIAGVLSAEQRAELVRIARHHQR